MLLNNFYAKYLEIVPIRPTTRKQYEWYYKKYLRSTIGKRDIRTITKIDLREILNTPQTSSAQTNLRSLIKSIFREAESFEIIEQNPASALKIQKYRPKRREFLTWQRLQNIDLGPERPKFLFLASHGLRISEALALTERDIQDGFVIINKSIHGPHTKSGKERKVPYMGYFEGRWCTTQHRLNYDFKFRTGLVLHSLRKTYAHLLKTTGIHPQVAQKLLGHSSIQLTMDLYTDVLPTEIEDAGLALKMIL